MFPTVYYSERNTQILNITLCSLRWLNEPLVSWKYDSPGKLNWEEKGAKQIYVAGWLIFVSWRQFFAGFPVHYVTSCIWGIAPYDGGDIYCLSDSIVDDMNFFLFQHIYASWGKWFLSLFLFKKTPALMTLLFLFLNGRLSRKLLTPAVGFCFTQTIYSSNNILKSLFSKHSWMELNLQLLTI